MVCNVCIGFAENFWIHVRWSLLLFSGKLLLLLSQILQLHGVIPPIHTLKCSLRDNPWNYSNFSLLPPLNKYELIDKADLLF